MLSQSSNGYEDQQSLDIARLNSQIAIVLGQERLFSNYNELLEAADITIKDVCDKQSNRFSMTNAFLNEMREKEKKENESIKEIVRDYNRKVKDFEKGIDPGSKEAYLKIKFITLNALIRMRLKERGINYSIKWPIITDAYGTPLKDRFVLAMLNQANHIENKSCDGDTLQPEALIKYYQIILENLKKYLHKIKQKGEQTSHFSLSDSGDPLRDVVNFLVQADNLFLLRADISPTIGEGNRAFIGVYAGKIAAFYKPLEMFPELCIFDKSLKSFFDPNTTSSGDRIFSDILPAKASPTKSRWRLSAMFGQSTSELITSDQKKQLLDSIIATKTRSSELNKTFHKTSRPETESDKLVRVFNKIYSEKENGPELIQHYIYSLLSDIYPLITGLAQIRNVIKNCLNIKRLKANACKDERCVEPDATSDDDESKRRAMLERRDSLMSQSFRNLLEAGEKNRSPRTGSSPRTESGRKNSDRRLERTDSLLSPHNRGLSIESPRDSKVVVGSPRTHEQDLMAMLTVNETSPRIFAVSSCGSRRERKLKFTIKEGFDSELEPTLEQYIDKMKLLKDMIERLKKVLELRRNAKEDANKKGPFTSTQVHNTGIILPKLLLGHDVDYDASHLFDLSQLNALIEKTIRQLETDCSPTPSLGGSGELPKSKFSGSQ